jgi:hypothetical protein
MEGMKQFISLDENNKLLIRGNAVISEKGVIPSFDGEFVMYGGDVQKLMVLLNEGNYLRREEIQLRGDDGYFGGYFGHCGWNTFAILKDEQVAEMLKKQDATIKELREIEKRLSDNVKTRIECEKLLTAKIEMLEYERKALKKEIEEHKFTIKTLGAVNGVDDCKVLKDVTSECFNDSKGAIKRFFGWFKNKK